MGFNCGIVGLPNVGKSTLFNALTKAGAQSANYPFCTIDPNVGRVGVPDKRLERLAKIFKSQKIIPAFMEFVDIAGLVKGASRGEGLGNQFLGNIRQVDAIVHVVRCFDGDITHVEGDTNPERDVDIINTELILSDYETVSKSFDRVSKLLKSPDKKIQAHHAFLSSLKAHLEAMKPARQFEIEPESEEALFLRDLHLITGKPVLYAANVAEEDLGNLGETCAYVQRLKALAALENARVVVVSARIEEELSQLENEELDIMLQDLGIAETGLSRLIASGYELLGLQTYFTMGPKEAHAWTIQKGMKAPAAAGVIHSDFEKGFICAETYACDDILRLGSENAVKEAGLLRKEGRNYDVRDGDIMHFLFNV